MKLFNTFFLLLLTATVFSKQIDEPTARKVGANFLKSINSNPNGRIANQDFDLILAYPATAGTSSSRISSSESAPYFIYNFGESGFVIVSNDNASFPILGYSFESSFSESTISPTFRKWMETYKKQIQYIQTIDVKPTSEVMKRWESLLNDDGNPSSTSAPRYAPLIQTKWGQNSFFNEKCPFDSEQNKRVVTGNPATAMAQIMKHWGYPAIGSNYHSFNHYAYGTLSANFGSTYYDWESMPEEVIRSNDEIATLMYHCGVAVEMEYGPDVSGSYVIIEKSPSPKKSCEYAYINYFGYDAESIKGLMRKDYTDDEWKKILKAELEAGRPIQYAGFGQGGHTWVCDGYDDHGDFFHMNWGWAGNLDGYYLLDALNPGIGGVGAGAGSYNQDQQALVGIRPPGTAPKFELEIHSNVETDKSTISYLEKFTITTDILNSGKNTFTGDVAAVIFDEKEGFVSFVDIISGVSLQSGNNFSDGITFSSEGLLNMLPGKYRVYIMYSVSPENWKGIKSNFSDLSTLDFTEIEVVNDNLISLNSTIDILTPDLYSEGTFSLKLDIANNSTQDFIGTLNVSLLNLDGEFGATIEEKTNVTLCSTCNFTEGLTFTTNNLNVPPGTYLLVLFHKWDGMDYEITGSSTTLINPTKVIIQQPLLVPDTYESNDDSENASKLTADFSENQANISTSGANFNVGSDWDYYSVVLESNYDYSIGIRLHDAYNSGNGNTYTVDGLFLYSFDGKNWSEAYDDVLPNLIETDGQKKLIIVVSPYILGERGSYQLDITIARRERTVILGFGDEISQFTIYPNPTTESFSIGASKSASQIDRIEIFNLQGQLVLLKENCPATSEFGVGHLSSGTYIVRLNYDGQSVNKKLVVR